MERYAELIRLLVPLLLAVYLGFYVFGLVMGVFAPFEQYGFTIAAAVCVAGLGAYALARSRGVEPVAASSPLARSERAQRERRGW